MKKTTTLSDFIATFAATAMTDRLLCVVITRQERA